MPNLPKTKRRQAGFIALISVIIISSVLLLTAVTSSLSGFYGRYNALDRELKEESSALAQACVDTALLYLANDRNYSGDTNVVIDTESCYIGYVTTFGGQTIFTTRSAYKNYYTNIKVTLDSNTLSVISWQEIPTS